MSRLKALFAKAKWQIGYWSITRLTLSKYPRWFDNLIWCWAFER